VRDEEVEVAVVDGALIAREDPPDELAQALQAGARQVRAGTLLREQGLAAAEVRRALDPPPLAVRTLEEDDEDRAGIAFTASLILYLQLIVYGLAVATGVVEEKASRVVEVLLATISPRPLLAGKIVGIGLLGLLQLLGVGVVGLAAAVASGAIDLGGGDAGALAVTLVWFLFGYALWATLYAIAGVIVSRQEDLQSSSAPLTMLLVVSYLVVFPVLDDPSSTLAVVASLVPLCSPIVMPALVTLGDAGAVEIVASLGLLAVSVLVLLALGARIYEGAILRMGRPLKLTEAWRLARASD
jgi:ABC-2 type transport system permease protein